MDTDRHLLFLVMAYSDELLDLAQLSNACRVWTQDKSKPLAELLVEWGWLTAEQRDEVQRRVERKLKKRGGDVSSTLSALADGAVRDVFQQIDDPEVRESLSSWPKAGHVLIETLPQPLPEETEATSRYTLKSPPLGQGGLGRVWIAYDKTLNREVALKELRPDKPESQQRDFWRRFLKEAQVTGQLQHPGIVPVYDVERRGKDQPPVYTMKLVQGRTLFQAIADYHTRRKQGTADPLGLPNLLQAFQSVCQAIAYAHSRGVVHRDLKPANIVLGDYGEVIVLDWGEAKLLGEAGSSEAKPVGITDDAEQHAKTTDGVGTPGYLAPEQAQALLKDWGIPIPSPPAGTVTAPRSFGAVDHRTDVYNLGATLFEILCGDMPHLKQKGDGPFGMYLRIFGQTQPPRPRERLASIPEELDAICAKAMASKPEDRFQSAKEFHAALLEFQVHKESIDLSTTAAEQLQQARQSGKYQDFSRALFAFEEALRQWSANTRASSGVRETQFAYAQCAFQRGDYDLALSLLNPIPTEPERSGYPKERNAPGGRESDAQVLKQPTLAGSQPHDACTDMAELRIRIQRAASERAEQRALAVAHAKEAVRQTKLAQRHLYVAHMNLAQIAWDGTRVGETVRLLELHRPAVGEEGGPNDLRSFEWFYWDRCCHSDLLTLKGNTGSVTSVAFSPDGKLLASAGSDQTVQLWDAATGQESFTLKGHSGAVRSLVFSPDGQRLASASDDEMVKLWNAATGQELLTLKGHTALILSVAISPDGLRLASASDDEAVKVWDANTGQELHTLKGHTAQVMSVAFSPDGQRLASASADETVKIWDAITGVESLTLRGHIGSIWSVAFSPDGQRLASASSDQTIKVWDAATGQELFTLKGHTDTVRSVAFSANAQRLASASYDKTVKVWDANTGQEVISLKGHTAGVTSVAFSPDGLRLASAGGVQFPHNRANPGEVKLWDAAEGQESLTLDGHAAGVTSVAFSPDGLRLASAAGWDATVKLWDAATGQESFTLTGHTDKVTSVAFSPDGLWLASASHDQTVKLWDAATGQESLTLKGHTDRVNSVAFSPDGLRLASASDDQTVKVWNAATGQESLTLKGHAGSVESVAFTPDGQRLASASSDRTVKVWDATTGQELLTMKGDSDKVTSVSFSPDQKHLASASDNGTVKVWDAATGQETLTLNGHTAFVYSVAFSPAGQRLASASWDQTVKVWDVATGQETLTLKGHTAAVQSVVFSPDGQRLASASVDGTVKVWNATPRH